MSDCFSLSPESFCYLFGQLSNSTEMTQDKVTEAIISLISNFESIPILVELLENEDLTIKKYSAVILLKATKNITDGNVEILSQCLQKLIFLLQKEDEYFSSLLIQSIFQISRITNTPEILREHLSQMIQNSDLMHSVQLAMLLSENDDEIIEVLIDTVISGLQSENVFIIRYALNAASILIERQELEESELISGEKLEEMRENIVGLLNNSVVSKNEGIIKCFVDQSILSDTHLYKFIPLDAVLESFVASLSSESTQTFAYNLIYLFSSIVDVNKETEIDGEACIQILDLLVQTTVSLYDPEVEMENQLFYESESAVIPFLSRIGLETSKEYVMQRIETLCEGEEEANYAVAVLLMKAADCAFDDFFASNYLEIFSSVFEWCEKGSEILKLYINGFLISIMSSPSFLIYASAETPYMEYIQKILSFLQEFEFVDGLLLIPVIIEAMPSVDAEFQSLFDVAKELIGADLSLSQKAFNIVIALIKNVSSLEICSESLWDWTFSFIEGDSEQKYYATQCIPYLISKDADGANERQEIIVSIMQEMLQDEDSYVFWTGLEIFIQLSQIIANFCEDCWGDIIQCIFAHNSIKECSDIEAYTKRVVVPEIKSISYIIKFIDVCEENMEVIDSIFGFINDCVETRLPDAVSEAASLLLSLTRINKGDNEHFSQMLSELNVSIVSLVISSPLYMFSYLTIGKMIKVYGIGVLCGKEEEFLVSLISTLMETDNDPLFPSYMMQCILESIDEGKCEEFIQSNLENVVQKLELLDKNYFCALDTFICVSRAFPDELLQHIIECCFSAVENNKNSGDATSLLTSIIKKKPETIPLIAPLLIQSLTSFAEKLPFITVERILLSLCIIETINPGQIIPLEVVSFILDALPFKYPIDPRNSDSFRFLVVIDNRIVPELEDKYLSVIAHFLALPVSQFIKKNYSSEMIHTLAMILLKRLSTSAEGIQRIPILLDNNMELAGTLANTIRALVGEMEEKEDD